MSHEQNIQDAALLLEHLAAGARQRSELPDLVDQLSRGAENVQASRRLSALATTLRNQGSLGEALQRWPGLDQGTLKAWVDDADAQGTLANTLALLSGDLRLRTRRLQRARLALLWPAFTMATSVVVALLASLFIIPAYRSAVDDLGLSMPNATASYFGSWSPGIVIPGMALVVVVWLMTARSDWPDRIYHGLRLDKGRWEHETELRLLPFLQVADMTADTARLVTGYLAETTPIRAIRRRLLSAQERLVAGDSLAVAVQRAGLVPASVVVHLDVARRTENLPAVGDLLNDQLQARWALASARFERRITGLVYLLAAIMAYQLLVAIYLPIFKLGSNL